MIIAGGSGSTGSSLLQAILHRHPAVLAGQETCLFIYPHLFYKWNRYKHFLMRRGVLGVKSTGWSLRNGMDLLHNDYGWESKELKLAIRHSDTFKTFVHRFFQKPLERKGAAIWVEKTPQNACSFQAFLSNYPEGKVIHTVRNPYDTIASLLARGFHPYEAAGYYVYHTAAALSTNRHQRYSQIRYEDLTNCPEAAVRPIFEFIGLLFDPAVLIPGEDEIAHPLKLKGWRYSERGPIEKGSVGRFAKLHESQQREIIAALNVFSINNVHLKKHKIHFPDAQSICKELGYEYLETDPTVFIRKFQDWQKSDMLRRTLRLHPTHFLNYPGKLIRR